MVDKMNVFGKATEELGKLGKETPAFGIDLGTTNSAIAVVQYGTTPKVIKLKNGTRTLQSCVMWKGKKHGFVVGKDAYNNRYKKSTVYSVKRLMGTQEKVKLSYGGKYIEMTPEEVSAEILKELVKQASDQYKGIKDVVISVPAYFSTDQVKATIKAGELAGLNVLSTVREPTAALLCYGLQPDLNKTEVVLAYDLGGGTFDTSLIHIENKKVDFDGSELSTSSGGIVYNVIDTDGDARLGGDDVDLELYKILEREIEKLGWDPKDITKEDKEKLILRLETLKKSGIGDYKMNLTLKRSKDGEVFKSVVPFRSEFFHEAIEAIFTKTMRRVFAVLQRSAHKAGLIDKILLVGGSTKSDYLKQLLRKQFEGVELIDALNPDEAVALGAAVKAKEDKFGDMGIEVFDVIPQNIGILAENNLVKPIVFKNTRVPITMSKLFETSVDSATEVQIHLFEGDSPHYEECTYLGAIHLPVKKDKAGEQDVLVTLKVDSNGTLRVFVKTSLGEKEVELVSLFGTTKSKSENTRNDKLVRRWMKFANTLDPDRKAMVLRWIDLFSTGEISRNEIESKMRSYVEPAYEVKKFANSSEVEHKFEEEQAE